MTGDRQGWDGGKEQRSPPEEVLQQLAHKNGLQVLSQDFAKFMDANDPLKDFRKKFAYPKKGTLESVNPALVDPEEECVYLCGHSLGLKPLTADARVKAILESWANTGVEMHFREPLPSALCDRYGRESLGALVGSEPTNVVLMNGLSVNLHLLMLSFYQPTAQRYKILIEDHAFPSDRYAMVSQAKFRGLSPEEVLIQVKPRPGEHTIRNEDIIKLLENEGSSIAVVCLSGVQYYTGQKFDMEAITTAGKKAGCVVGWDLAHAIGNVDIHLQDWGVDFACWCTYKYLNSGPGCIGGAFVNPESERGPQLQGWWSNSDATRFQMRSECDMAPGVDSFRICNPPPILATLVLASLEIYDEAGFPRLLDKQFLLTGYLELLLKEHFGSGQAKGPTAEIITPKDTTQRGCQLSIAFSYPLDQVHKQLGQRGVVCDVRLPNVMRIAPAPLYNSFTDVHSFITILSDVVVACKLEAA